MLILLAKLNYNNDTKAILDLILYITPSMCVFQKLNFSPASAQSKLDQGHSGEHPPERPCPWLNVLYRKSSVLFYLLCCVSINL